MAGRDALVDATNGRSRRSLLWTTDGRLLRWRWSVILRVSVRLSLAKQLVLQAPRHPGGEETGFGAEQFLPRERYSVESHFRHYQQRMNARRVAMTEAAGARVWPRE